MATFYGDYVVFVAIQLLVGPPLAQFANMKALKFVRSSGFFQKKTKTTTCSDHSPDHSGMDLEGNLSNVKQNPCDMNHVTNCLAQVPGSGFSWLMK